MENLTKEDIQKMIDKSVTASFASKRVGDTPTDAYQLVPKSYVDRNKTYIGQVNADGTSATPFPTGWTSSLSVTIYTITHNLGTTDYAVFATAISTGAFPRITAMSSTSFNLIFSDASGTNTTTAFNFSLVTSTS